MLALCRRCTSQEADAEEAFSRASLLLYRKLPAYYERLDNLRGWILRLTFNVCMSLHREIRRRGEQSLEEVSGEGVIDPRLLTSRGGHPESAYLQKEMGRFLRRSIEELPERLRETVIGHLSWGSYREIADHLSINEANARKRMQEARQILARRLARYRAGAARMPASLPHKKPGQAARPFSDELRHAESSASCLALAELHIAAGRPKEAADALDEVLTRSPVDLAALTLGAEPLRLLGRSSEARRRDARALELDAANPAALERSLAATVRRAGGRLLPELDSWRAVERLARTRATARSLLGFLRICSGDLAGLGETFFYVLEKPQCLEGRIEHARLQDAIGRPLAALQELDVSRVLQREHREVDLLACRASIRAGLPERALLETENLLARYGDAWDIASTAAWALAHLGKTGRAVELSRVAVARQPRLPAAWLEHGRVLARCERLRDAIAATETGWSLIPEGDGFDLATPAALDLAGLHRRLGDLGWAHQWALQALEACAVLGESDPIRAHVLWSWIQAELGTEVALPVAGFVEIAPSFLRIEERRLLTMEISESSVG